MSQEYIEITEKTVDDAITTACQRLSVTSNRLDYIVVQREKSGFLGIGAKPAIIKARIKDAADATQAILDDVINKAEKKMLKDTVRKEEKPEAVKAPEPVVKKEVKEAKKAEKTEKTEKAEHIAKELGDYTKWKTHGRPINLQVLESLGLKINDYSNNSPQREIIRKYYKLMMEYVSINKFPLFVHTRHFL